MLNTVQQRRRSSLDLSDERARDELTPEERAVQGVWSGVLVQAIMDMSSKSRKPEMRRVREDARAWLLEGGEDFEEVCLRAGFNPDYVRAKVRAAERREFQWRLPVGSGWRTQRRMLETQQLTA